MKRMMIASTASLVLTSGLALAHGGGHGLARFDRDGNGAVTRDEMRTTAIEHFQKMDTNGDGRLTPDEIHAAHRRLMRMAHPDTGGSDWLASRINQARDVLLG